MSSSLAVNHRAHATAQRALRSQPLTVLVAALVLGVLPAPARAQTGSPPAGSDTASSAATPLAAVTVTATRTARETFFVPQPVAVLDSAALRERLANSAVELFRYLPGLDVTGVGSNQLRPQIRGQRGQRILLLQDGLRLNNSRRQQDFGELPALAGLTDLHRVEVVRGPSSVLYGTDAIGGVINIISPDLPGVERDGEIHGFAAYRHGSADRQRLPSGGIQARFGRFAFRASGAHRGSDPYFAPAGTFGDITLDSEVPVHGTGVRDDSFDAAAGFDLLRGQRLIARAKRYRARNAGFGYVEPDQLGPNQPLIDIAYPQQSWARYTVGYRATGLHTPLADRVEITTYLQRNERDLTMHVFVPFAHAPGAGVETRLFNFTDLRTGGLRAEAAKLLGGRTLLTYGLDFFRDRSVNTDSTHTVVTGFGPPQTRFTNTPQVPNATLSSTGAFAQADMHILERLSLILGGRFQAVEARTRETPGIDRPLQSSRDQTGVGAVNLLYRVADGFNLITSVGRGFRSPNLVERFFEGVAPEGSGFQRANPDLEPETSINIDVGARYRRGIFYAESFVFRNRIRDGIRIAATGDSVGGRPAFRNINVDRLRHSGAEVLAGVRAFSGLDISASYTKLDTRNVSDPNNPVGDSYGSKLTGDVAYRQPAGRFTVGYTARRNGEHRDAIVGANPVGTTLPAFTTHSLRANLFLFERGGVRNQLGFTVENLTNELYAESANASFFRPEPRRSFNLSLLTEF
jgi:hemoglobin/transferrin/lactoferrin receptor protein